MVSRGEKFHTLARSRFPVLPTTYCLNKQATFFGLIDIAKRNDVKLWLYGERSGTSIAPESRVSARCTRDRRDRSALLSFV